MCLIALAQLLTPVLCSDLYCDRSGVSLEDKSHCVTSRGYHSGDSEDSGLLGCEAVTPG